MDDTANGMRNNFEAAVAFLLPTDPVDKKKSKNSKRNIAEVSGVDTGGKSLGSHKSGRGKSGVEFRYYKPSEFKKLNQAQITELLEHRKNNPSGQDSTKGKGGKGKKEREKRFRTSVSSVVKTAIQDMVDEHSKSEEQMKTQRSEMHEALVASLKAFASGSNPTAVTANASAIEALKVAVETPPAPPVKSSVGILASATRPKGKPLTAVDFAPTQDGGDMDASVAATKLMKLMYSMGSGKKKGSP